MRLTSRTLLTIVLVAFAGCGSVSQPSVAARVTYHFDLLVQQTDASGRSESVTQRVRIQVRGTDGSLLFTGWTRENGTLDVSFTTASLPQQIEATVPDAHLPGREPRFNGAIVGMDAGQRRYCIILPPGCLF